MNHISTLVKALEYPEYDIGTYCITKSNLDEILQYIPKGSCLSEWRYACGVIIYKYRLHKGPIVQELKAAYDAGIKGGGPRALTGVYIKKD